MIKGNSNAQGGDAETNGRMHGPRALRYRAGRDSGAEVETAPKPGAVRWVWQPTADETANQQERNR